MHKRNCPICNKEIFYKSEYTKNSAEKHNTICFSCNGKKNGWNKINKEVTEGVRKNSFKDKKHSKESKKKMSNSRLKNSNIYKTLEFRNKMSIVTSGEKNGMFGKTIYDIWVEKYGIEEANTKEKTRKEKISLSTFGKNNPMYGKPTPTGSGNGWSGWYKNWYFRSLKELSYMIYVIERFNLKWETAERKKYKIKYLNWKGIERTYTADFLIDEKYLVEIKPKKLWNTLNVQRKKEVAIKFCKENNLIYKLTYSPRNLIFDDIKELIVNNKIKLIDRYQKKFNEYEKNK